jgi:preprotein translocase subunit SecA
MAGRGTDILLGGNPEALAAKVAPETEGEAYERALAKFKEKCAQEKQEVLEAGGLFILGTERHDSRRIDNQLRGRAGRQGDPGASRFFLSLEDDLMRRFGAERIQGLMARLGMEEGVPIEAGMVNKSIENAQSRVEGRNFDVRKHLLEYDDVMDVQRDTIYKIRRELLEGTGVFDKTLDVLEATLEGVLNAYASEEMRREDWDLEALAGAVKTAFDLEFDPSDLPTSRAGLEKMLWKAIRAHLDSRIDQLERIAEEANEDRERLIEHVAKIQADHAEAVRLAEENGDAVPPAPTLPEIPPVKDKMAVFVDVAQQAYLRDLDQAWIDHLKGMRMLRDSVSLHGYAQKDPKQLYKSEGYELFVALRARINSAVSEKICRIVVPTPEQSGSPELNGKYLIRSQRMIAQLRQRQQDEAARRAAAAQTNAAPAPAAGERPTRRVTMSPQRGLGAAAAAAAGAGGRPALPTLGRNDPCWCGSGKKYKQCHLRVDQSRGAEAPKNEGTPPDSGDDGFKLV